MKITTKDKALFVSKTDGTDVSYYLFPEYEVHVNELAPHSVQIWHHHEIVWETLYMIEGELTAQWKEKNEIKKQILNVGDLIETEQTPHTFSNDTDSVVKFIVLKQIINGENKRDVLKNDKVLD